jgi:hypothetical protein
MTDGGDKPKAPPRSSSAPTRSSETDADQPRPDDVEANAPAKDDVVFLGPPTDDGNGVHVLRARDQRLEAGELRSLEQGQPITGEVVSLAPRKSNPRVCDVRDSYRPPSLPSRPTTVTKGPAQVATQAYRDNWDETFARRPPRGALN